MDFLCVLAGAGFSINTLTAGSKGKIVWTFLDNPEGEELASMWKGQMVAQGGLGIGGLMELSGMIFLRAVSFQRERHRLLMPSGRNGQRSALVRAEGWPSRMGMGTPAER